MPIIYRKTAKGVTEIETRQHRLLPRARSALILVDGKRDVAVLKGLIAQQPEETLAMLLEQGFIEGGESPLALGQVDIPTEQVEAPKPVAKPTDGKPSPDYVARRRAAVRDLNDILGPSGEALAIRMERARDADELRPLVQTAAQIIGNARGRNVAEGYLQRHAL